MFCNNCGAPVSDGAKFCSSCGAQQQAAVPSVSTEPVCPFCGEMLEPDSVFCDNCGQMITGAIPQASVATQQVPVETPPSPVVTPPPPAVRQQIPIEAPPSPVTTTQPQIVTPPSPIAAPQAPVVNTQASNSKKSAGKIIAVVSIIVLSVLLVSSVGYIVWSRFSEPEETKTRNTKSRVTESEDNTEKETRKTRETKSSVDPTDKPVSGTSSETTEMPTAEYTTEPAMKHDPSDYQTSDMSTMADFQWITYDIMYGSLPSDVEFLADPQEIAGGWKAYIVDGIGGENVDYIERLCNCFISVSDQDVEVCIKWDYLYNGSADESYSEKDNPDSYYNGSWSNGGISATGSGRITITGFWYKNGKEYAVGTLTWADGMSSTVFLARP
jgi:hypothetical protein